MGPGVGIERLDDTVQLRLTGAWRLTAPDRPTVQDVVGALDPLSAVRRIGFDTSDLTDWDSSLLIFLDALEGAAQAASVEIDSSALPDGVRRLTALARAVPETKAEKAETPAPGLDRLGKLALAAGARFGDSIDFVGEVTQAFGSLLRGGARFRRADLLELTQQAGASALGIVSLVSFLMGLILAFVGAQQLRQFGATIYVADLVGVAMTRDMAALMTGIVMAGRSGGAYAAQLGIMNANQEIDALVTMGIPPIQYLVLPRVLALSAMLPLLVLYADLMGMLGGAIATSTLMDISWTEYWRQTASAVSVSHVVGGVFKGAMYGILVALTGCFQGIRAARSSTGVGAAATSAVVNGIVAIIVACGLFQILFDRLGI